MQRGCIAAIPDVQDKDRAVTATNSQQMGVQGVETEC